MEKFFKLKEHGTNARTEIIAGLTTFFTMAYIIFVNPNMLSITGMSKDGVFVATVLAAVIGTLMMAFVANVPYAQAPGMGLNAFFTFTVCGAMGFSWQQALSMVLICGIIGIIITVTGVRKALVKALPKTLQSAIGGGIGLFIAYIGVKEAGLLKFSMDPGTYDVFPSGAASANSTIVPALVNFSNPAVLMALFGIVLTIVLMVCRVKGAILIGIIGTAAASMIAIGCGADAHNFFSYLPVGSTLGDVTSGVSISPSHIAEQIGSIKDVAFKPDFGGLFADGKVLLSLVAIIGFVLTDIFDTIGTLIGTGKRTGIFDNEDSQSLETGKGMSSRMEKALFSDMVATSAGSLLGTSNVTTYVESAAGISEGGRTGMTSMVTAIMFLLCLPLVSVIGVIPAVATAPALIIVGVLMMGAILDIDWGDFSIAVVAFLTMALMPFTYSITTGIAFGFITYVLVGAIKGKAKEIHPIMYFFTGLFILNFILLAIKGI